MAFKINPQWTKVHSMCNDLSLTGSTNKAYSDMLRTCYRKLMLYTSCLLLSCVTSLCYSQVSNENNSKVIPLNFSVVKVTPRPLPYQDFCRRYPAECLLNGNRTIKLTPKALTLLQRINTQVNNEVSFMLDIDQYNQEEFWALPLTGSGDCEDKALEKRHRLAKLGFPRAAMRLMIASHKKFLNSHALLTIETDSGIYVMNSFTDKVKAWYQTPYNYEARERVDGQWDRYDQSFWTYEPHTD
ncbi:MAG: transglutaminase-like cysteine peptidase [Gammaproteobacteria bacterium]|nr:transglutaminase-like cysteine peptidase [Gammaproteobacteria bacterium]